MPMSIPQISPLTVPGTLESLQIISKAIMDAAAQAELDKKRAYGLRLAVDEIATNIILHGYEEAGRTGSIDLSFALGDGLLTVTLEDTGIPYNPFQNSLEPDELQQPIEDRPIGGLGVFLALDGVDDFAYDFVDGRNCNRLTLGCPVSASIS